MIVYSVYRVSALVHQDHYLCLQALKTGKKALDGKNGYTDRHTHSEAHKATEEKVALFLHTRQPGMNIIAKISKHVAKQQVRTY